MKKIIFLILFFSFFISEHSYSLETFVVFKVNNKIITNIDIDNEYRYLTALSPSLQKIDKKQLINLAKQSIIREKIKEDEILKHFDLSVENKLIDRIIYNFYKKMGMQTENEFKNYLSEHSLDYDDIKKKISIEAAWNDLIYKLFSKRIIIDEEKIKKKIDKLKSSSNELNVYLLSEILFTAENYEDLQKKNKLIKKSIKDVGFNSAANLHSIADSAKLGGKVGWVNESQLNEIIVKEVTKLNINNYTEPITVPGGFLIIKLENKKKEKKDINFDEEFNKQISIETNLQLNQFSEIFFKKIKKNSVINEK
tara:strand:+ start:242 stop:1171 length:930 start_codon:yes stop_codon:yes gene_type:complete